MHLKNQSPYDTRALRRVVVWTYQFLRHSYGPAPWWPSLTVHVLPAGAPAAGISATDMVIRVPKFRGTEWIALTRQHHHPPSEGSIAGELERIPGRGASCEEVANFAFLLMLKLYHRGVRGRFLPALPKEFPFLVPLRTARPAPPPRDVVRERHARVLELERTWTRKIKLAQTKLKKLRQRRRYYEKQLARRPIDISTTTEE